MCVCVCVCVGVCVCVCVRGCVRCRFPRAEKEAECAEAKKASDALRSVADSNRVKTYTTKLEENTKAAIAAAKGKDSFDTCPKELWDLFVTQTTLERLLVAPTYAGA